MAARIAATILSFVETCKLMKKNVLGFLKDFFDMVVSGKTDYDQMALDILGVNKKIKNEFIQLDGNLSTPVNTGAEQYYHRGWMLTPSAKKMYYILNKQVKFLTSQYIGTCKSAYTKGYALN